MKDTLLKIWKAVKNKYVAATLIFLLFFLFLGENNLIVTQRLKRELVQLNSENELLERDIRQDSAEAMALCDDPEALEAYGREHYYMKRADEDIFVIKPEGKGGRNEK